MCTERFSETSVHIRTTRHYFPEDGSIHNYLSYDCLLITASLMKWNENYGQVLYLMALALYGCSGTFNEYNTIQYYRCENFKSYN
jgi:hypothetical protein